MMPITLEINGEHRTVGAPENLQQLLVELDIHGDHIAIELNRRIVRRKDWGTIPVCDGDRIEIVQFVGGG